MLTAVSSMEAELSLTVTGGWLMESDGEEMVMFNDDSLWQRMKALLADDKDCCAVMESVQADLPTQRRHSKADPRALSHRPISLGGRPESFAHARFE